MDVEKTLKSLSLREKIYQTVVFRATPEFYNPQNAEEFFKRNPVGGVFVGPEVINNEKVTAKTIRESISAFKKASKVLPLFCADFERGCGFITDDEKLTIYPDLMTLGATDSASLAYEYGKGTAIEAHTLGINWNFAPVSDINVNPLNPATNTRSLGDKTDKVIPLLSSLVKGMNNHGLIATAKHFPGDGTDYRDQHFVISTNRFSTAKWWKTYGKIYKQLIKDGLLSVMAGHINFPAYQTERIDGVAPPATLSNELIGGLLKKKLGFKGVVVSDALIMSGFNKLHDCQTDAEIDCFKAGVDMMLWPAEEYVVRLEKEILSGNVSISRLDDAVRRILRVKKYVEEHIPNPTAQDFKDSKSVATAVAENGVTLIKDRFGEIPKKIKEVSIIGLSDFESDNKRLLWLKESFEKRNIKASLYFGKCDEPSKTKTSDFIIYVTACRMHNPAVHIDMRYPDWQTATFSRKKIIALATGSPYLINKYFETANIAFATYSDTKECYESFVKVLVGELCAKGKLPVTLQD